MSRRMVIGLTGGLASGKSTVLKMFQRLGAAAFDSDAEVHKLLSADAGIKRRLVAAFGRAILNIQGGVCRRRLGDIVFTSPAKLRRLEKIIHPEVIRRMRSFCGRHSLVAADIPLLFEAKLRGMVDKVVVVWVPRRIQLIRATRRGMTRTQALARIRMQMSLDAKRRLADFAVDNSGSSAEASVQVQNIWNELKALDNQRRLR